MWTRACGLSIFKSLELCAQRLMAAKIQSAGCFMVSNITSVSHERGSACGLFVRVSHKGALTLQPE
jgi:hypothetical protein